MDGDNGNTDILADQHDLREIMKEAKRAYEVQKYIVCPFFGQPVALTADGFYHLTHKPNRQPRNINEQKLKLRLLKRGLGVIKAAGTLQEYRKNMEPVGEPNARGFKEMRLVEHWAFHHIVGEKRRFLIRVIVRRVGEGKLHFWSVMPHGRIEKQKLYQEGIDID
jgi:hypothetical protein